MTKYILVKEVQRKQFSNMSFPKRKQIRLSLTDIKLLQEGLLNQLRLISNSELEKIKIDKLFIKLRKLRNIQL